jgi:hypothetical protein
VHRNPIEISTKDGDSMFLQNVSIYLTSPLGIAILKSNNMFVITQSLKLVYNSEAVTDCRLEVEIQLSAKN